MADFLGVGPGCAIGPAWEYVKTVYVGPAKIVFSSMFPTLAFMSAQPSVAIAGISPAIKIRSS